MTNEEMKTMLQKISDAMNNSNIDFAGNPDPEEKINIQDIEVNDNEIMLFNKNEVYHESELIEESMLNNTLLGILKNIFADVFSVQLKYKSGHEFNKWVFIVGFRYLTPEQYEIAKKEAADPDHFYRGISSTFDPSKTNSLAETFMSLVSNQNMCASDASKYASLTKDLKGVFYNYMLFARSDKKHRWTPGVNYNVHNVVQTGMNGMQYHNIIADVYLDAEEILNMLFSTKEDRKNNKYKYTISLNSAKTNAKDSLFEVHRYNKDRRRKLSMQYGIQFNN